MTVVDLATRRLEKIGGSEAAAACGVDPHTSRIMLWAEKTGKVEREQSEAMRWGNLLQPVVYAELEAREWEVMPAPDDEGVHPDLPWLTGHVDGYVNVDGERGVGTRHRRRLHANSRETEQRDQQEDDAENQSEDPSIHGDPFVCGASCQPAQIRRKLTARVTL